MVVTLSQRADRWKHQCFLTLSYVFSTAVFMLKIFLSVVDWLQGAAKILAMIAIFLCSPPFSSLTSPKSSNPPPPFPPPTPRPRSPIGRYPHLPPHRLPVHRRDAYLDAPRFVDFILVRRNHTNAWPFRAKTFRLRIWAPWQVFYFQLSCAYISEIVRNLTTG